MELTGKEIRERFREASEEDLPDLIAAYENDGRSAVQDEVRRAKNRLLKLEKERARVRAMRSFDDSYRSAGLVCGIDEAGRGPLAGPVVAAAVILPADCELLYLNDSKQMTPKRREELFTRIEETAVSFGVGIVSEKEIDRINILQADYEAMRIAIAKLSPVPDVCLNDAVTIPEVRIRQVPIIKGDAKSQSIAAASVLAKVTRDRIMDEYDRLYPAYGFAKNKGYASSFHIEKIRELGPCPIHRMTFLKGIIKE